MGPLVYRVYYVYGTKFLNFTPVQLGKMSQKTTLLVTEGGDWMRRQAPGWRAAAWRSGARRPLTHSGRPPPIMMFW